MSEVKEVKEVVVAMLELSVLLADAFKDGVQASDVLEVFEKIKADPDLSAKLLAAYNDASKVPSEVKSLDLAGGIELLAAVGPEVMKLVKALSK